MPIGIGISWKRMRPKCRHGKSACDFRSGQLAVAFVVRKDTCMFGETEQIECVHTRCLISSSVWLSTLFHIMVSHLKIKHNYSYVHSVWIVLADVFRCPVSFTHTEQRIADFTIGVSIRVPTFSQIRSTQTPTWFQPNWICTAAFFVVRKSITKITQIHSNGR